MDSCDSQHVVLKKIYTLRGITALLQILQDPDLAPEQSHWDAFQELIHELDTVSRTEDRRLFDAFATVLAVNNEIVAVTTKDGTLSASLVACSHARSGSMSLASNVPSSLLGDLEGRFLAVVVENRFLTWPDPTTDDSESPFITQPKQSTIDPKNPIPYLKGVLTSLSFPSHAAALVSLLKAAARGEGNNFGVFSYVAATMNRKMLHRLRHETKFKQVLERLTSIPPSQIVQSARTFPDHQYDDPISAQQDVAFLEVLKAPFNQKFFRLSTIGIDNLMAVATAHKPGTAIPPIYTKETCSDIHRLLCHLLRCYEMSMTMLSNFEGLSSAEVHADEFEVAVSGVTTCGLTLCALVNSTFIDEHMFRTLPSDHYSWQPLDAERSLQGSEDAETEFDLRRHGCADWLRSLTKHYEAAGELLAMAPRMTNKEISIDVVAVPQSGTSMLPWKQVVEEMMSSNSMMILPYTLQDAISAVENFVSRSANLSARLKGDMSQGRNFSAVVHSQACLASVIHRSDLGNLDPNCAFGVSEPCCQVCSHLISLLGIPEPRGSIHEKRSMPHQQVVASTLPPWLPLPIHDAMISHFRAELMLVIQKLCLETQTKPSDGSMHPSPSTDSLASGGMSWFSAFVERFRGLL